MNVIGCSCDGPTVATDQRYAKLLTKFRYNTSIRDAIAFENGFLDRRHDEH